MSRHPEVVLIYQRVLHQLRRVRSMGLIDDKKFIKLEADLVNTVGLDPSSCHRENSVLNELLYKKHDGNITPDQEDIK